MLEIRDFSKELCEYVDGVLSGEIISCKMLKRACQRHVDDIARQQDSDFEFWFDMQEANIVLTVISELRVPIGKYAGQQFEPFDFQVFIFAMLYGWREKKPTTINTIDHNGDPYEYTAYLRRFSEAFISLGRGNSKTPIAAINCIIQVGFDRPFFVGAEVYLAATTEEETSKTFSFSKSLIEESNLDGFETFEKAIIYKNKNFIKRLAAVGGDSFEIQSVIRDELHAWKSNHQKFYGKLRTGLGKRPQPLAITTTTSGDDQSVIYIDEIDYARKVLDPNIDMHDEKLFVFVCELDIAEIDPLTGETVGESDDIYDEELWPKANPATKYGLINLDEIRRLAKKAKSGDKAAEKDLKRYHLNIRTSSRLKVFTPEKWAIGHHVNFAVPDDTPVSLGLDLGFRDDLASIATVELCGEGKFDHYEDGELKQVKKPLFRLDADIWLPSDGVRDITSKPWPSWIEDNLVRICPGEEVQVSFIKKRLEDIIRRDRRNVFAIYADQSWGRELLQWIQEEFGIEPVAMAQTCWQFNDPMREFISAVTTGRVSHNNPVLDWCADNMIAKNDAQGRIMPWKSASADKIDPMVASIMAFAGAIYEKPKQRRSVYSKRGFQVV